MSIGSQGSMLCCHGTTVSIYSSTFTSTMCFSMENTSLKKKKDQSPKLLALLSHDHTKTYLLSHACWHTIRKHSAYIMLIVPIILSKGFEYMGIRHIPTCYVYLLPRIINILFVCVSGPVDLIVY